MQGTVKWFSESKGYGFLTDGKDDYFVHFKNIQSPGFKTLTEGQKVSFNSSKGLKGMEAKDVKVEGNA